MFSLSFFLSCFFLGSFREIHRWELSFLSLEIFDDLSGEFGSITETVESFFLFNVFPFDLSRGSRRSLCFLFSFLFFFETNIFNTLNEFFDYFCPRPTSSKIIFLSFLISISQRNPLLLFLSGCLPVSSSFSFYPF